MRGPDRRDGRPTDSGSEGRHPGWPVELGPVAIPIGELRLRPLRRRDGADWQRLRLQDEALISPWDASMSISWLARHSPAAWTAHRTALRAAARRGEVLPFAIEAAGRFAGQVTVGGIQRGAVGSAWVGYWVDSALHGRRVASTAVALAVAHCFGAAGLFRVEATIAPENGPSLAVVRRLGFRQEGHLRGYLDVGGSRRDHLLFALTAPELPGGLPELLARANGTTDGH